MGQKHVSLRPEYEFKVSFHVRGRSTIRRVIAEDEAAAALEFGNRERFEGTRRVLVEWVDIEEEAQSFDVHVRRYGKEKVVNVHRVVPEVRAHVGAVFGL